MSVHMQNKRALANGTLLYHHITQLVGFWQEHHGIEATGHADEATCAALETAAQAHAAKVAAAAEAGRIADHVAAGPPPAEPVPPPAEETLAAGSADETLPEPARSHGRHRSR